eukprot:4892773-Prymnesium_polylepis.1
MAEPEVLYRLALKADIPEDAWRTRLQWTGAFVGDQTTNKFISLLTAGQLASAALTMFEGKTDVMLLSFTVESMREEADLKVKFEAAEAESGGTGAFAHVYGGVIPYACLYSAPALLALEDGKHVFPLTGAAAVAAGMLVSEKEAYESDAGTDDGLEPFNQHKFDEDD